MPTSGQEQPSLSEIGRILEALRAETASRFDKIDAKFDRIDGTYVRRETYEALATTTSTMIASLTSDLERMQNSQSWVIRTIGGAIIVSVIGGLFAASKIVGAS